MSKSLAIIFRYEQATLVSLDDQVQKDLVSPQGLENLRGGKLFIPGVQPKIFIASDITYSKFYGEFRKQCAPRTYSIGDRVDSNFLLTPLTLDTES